MKSPCTPTCPKRSPDCHCTCPEFKAYHDEKVKEYEGRVNQAQLTSSCHDLMYKNRVRHERNRKPKWN